MKWQRLVLDLLQRQTLELEKLLDGLTGDDLNRQPAPECNSIGWLVWHSIRSLDRNFSPMLGQEQLWLAEKWHARFGREPDPNETGYGHTAAQAGAFLSPDTETILAYNKAITDRVLEYVNDNLEEPDLDREVYIPTLNLTHSVAQIIEGEFWHTIHHFGQAGYVRGIIKEKGWYGR